MGYQNRTTSFAIDMAGSKREAQRSSTHVTRIAFTPSTGFYGPGNGLRFNVIDWALGVGAPMLAGELVQQDSIAGRHLTTAGSRTSAKVIAPPRPSSHALTNTIKT